MSKTVDADTFKHCRAFFSPPQTEREFAQKVHKLLNHRRLLQQAKVPQLAHSRRLEFHLGEAILAHHPAHHTVLFQEELMEAITGI